MSLSVRGFRNLANLALKPAPGVNILYGSNGTGKTNLLEAIFVLCLGRSQRGAQDNVLVQQGCDVYRLEGEVETGNRRYTVSVAFQRGGRKKVTIDGVVSKLRELYEHFCVVSVGPEDSDILAGPPSARRTFLDIYLSQLSQSYLNNLSDYQKALSQKNAALKNGMDPGLFDEVLVSYGSRIVLARQEFLSSLRDTAAGYYREIAGGESLSIEYKPSVPVDSEHASLSDIETMFQVRLEDQFDREKVMQTAMVGPHRDDVQFDVAGYPARSHGSQGQCRTAAVSLKLSIYHLLKEKRRMPPLLLLDEIFAELDEARTDSLIGAFDGFSQLFLTTAQRPPAKLRDTGRTYPVTDGKIESEA